MANSFLGMFRSTKQDDPMATVKALNAWAAGLPAKDPLGVLEAVVRLLEDMGTIQSEITANRALALKALDRLTLPRQTEVLAQYRMPTLSDDVRRRLWHACNDLARWFAYAYARAGGVVAGPDGEVKKPGTVVPGVYSRMFYYRGLQSRLGLLHYESWISGSWKILHGAYEEACAQGVETKLFALAESADPGDQYSAEQEFVQILLLQRINSGNLTANQVEWAAQWLRAWVRTLKLSEPPAKGDGYWLDLGQGEGLAPKRPASPAGRLLYLDVKPLHEQLSALLALLGEKAAKSGGADQAESRVLEEQLKLARQLGLFWSPQAGQRARRGERRVEKRPVTVEAGWAAIVAAMREGRVRRPFQPHQYTYDDATGLAVHGHLRNTPREDPYSIEISPTSDRYGWQLQDISESGVRIVSAAKEAQRQQIGSLLALRSEGDSRWGIGIVRRLRRRTTEHTELGVEVIADDAVMTTAVPVAGRDSGYSVDGVDAASTKQGFQALYLPPQQHSRSQPVRSIVLPANEFAPGRRLSINLEGVAREVRLFVPLEHSKDWIWTSFEMPGEPAPA